MANNNDDFYKLVSSSAEHQAAYDAAKSGDWDKAATHINNLTMDGAKMSADGGSYDVDYDKATAANNYWIALQNELGYDANKYYGVRGGNASGSASSGGSKSKDFSKYLKDQYAAQIESQLAGLKTAYENSMNGYNDSMERLPQQYATARNNAAAQDAIARKQFDERAVASGLNTGTSGQAELARESTYRGNIADIDSAEGNAKADLDLQMKNLQSQYESAIAKAEADGKANLANALYQEMVRAQNYTLQQQSAAQQQANWEAQFAFQQQQYADALAQQQREWDFTQQQYADKQAAAAAKVAARYTPSYTPTPTPTSEPTPAPAPAAASYTPNASGFSAMGLETILNRDGGQAAQEYLNKYWDGMSNAEKTRAQLVFSKYA